MCRKVDQLLNKTNIPEYQSAKVSADLKHYVNEVLYTHFSSLSIGVISKITEDFIGQVIGQGSLGSEGVQVEDLYEKTSRVIEQIEDFVNEVKLCQYDTELAVSIALKLWDGSDATLKDVLSEITTFINNNRGENFPAKLARYCVGGEYKANKEDQIQKKLSAI